MKCEDCIPLIEEFFDGEVDERTGEQMSAHLSACADCAAALDALSFEQEIYARYDRQLEVTPALWAAVSAEIAREPRTDEGARRRPFLSRLRDMAVAPFAVFTLRPALASSLALLVVGVAAGALWLAHVRRATNPTVAVVNQPSEQIKVTNEPPATVVGNEPTIVENTPTVTETASGVRENEKSTPTRAADSGGKFTQPEQLSPEGLIRKAIAIQTDNSGIVHIRPDDHPQPDTVAQFVNASSVNTGVERSATNDAGLLDPGEMDVARHVERTQVLLRSIKNARPSDDNSTVNVSYEKNLSRKLLAENATLQLEADVKGDKDTKQVLDKIEPFLLDIANMRDQPSREEVHSLKERMKKNEIIAALQVY
jgi:hypothetical protein